MARKNPVDRLEIEVGRRLRAVREWTHLAQTRFAMILRIGSETLSSYESGRVPLPMRVGQRVCETWGVNPFWLSDGVGPRMERYSFSTPEEFLRERRSFRTVLSLALEPSAAVDAARPPAKVMQSAQDGSRVVVLPTKDFFPSREEEPEEYFDSRVVRVVVDRREHDAFARQACILHYGAVCQVCKMKFDEVYGEIGSNFIEVHHAVPVGGRGEDSIGNLVPLCSNCHNMIHRRSPPYSVAELQKIVSRGS